MVTICFLQEIRRGEATQVPVQCGMIASTLDGGKRSSNNTSEADDDVAQNPEFMASVGNVTGFVRVKTG